MVPWNGEKARRPPGTFRAGSCEDYAQRVHMWTSGQISLIVEETEETCVILAIGTPAGDLAPLDAQTLIKSAIKTGHVLIVDEAYQSFGVSAEIAAQITEGAFDYLDEPERRLGAADVPVPFAPSLEDLTIPDAGKIVDVIRRMRT